MTRLSVRRLVVAGLCLAPLLTAPATWAGVTITGNPAAPHVIALSTQFGGPYGSGTGAAYSLTVDAQSSGLNWSFPVGPRLEGCTGTQNGAGGGWVDKGAANYYAGDSFHYTGTWTVANYSTGHFWWRGSASQRNVWTWQPDPNNPMLSGDYGPYTTL